MGQSPGNRKVAGTAKSLFVMPHTHHSRGCRQRKAIARHSPTAWPPSPLSCSPASRWPIVGLVSAGRRPCAPHGSCIFELIGAHAQPLPRLATDGACHRMLDEGLVALHHEPGTCRSDGEGRHRLRLPGHVSPHRIFARAFGRWRDPDHIFWQEGKCLLHISACENFEKLADSVLRVLLQSLYPPYPNFPANET